MGTSLVVEDDPYQREMVCIILEEAVGEPEIIECATAEAALSVLDRRGRDIEFLITDVQLAGLMTGVELAEIARRRFSNIHLIVTSGRVKPEMLPPNAAFLPKPWRPLDLIQQLNK